MVEILKNENFLFFEKNLHPAGPRALWLKNSEFQIHGTGPGPMANPTMYPKTQTMHKYGITGDASNILRQTVIATQLKNISYMIGQFWVSITLLTKR